MDLFPTDNSPGGSNPRFSASEPERPNPYGVPFDSCLTWNGRAAISVLAGTATGQILIKAWCHIDERLRGTPDADSIVAVTSELIVTGGPPHHVDIDIDENGEDGGGGIWILEVSAMVMDILNHPVLRLTWDRIPHRYRIVYTNFYISRFSVFV